MKIMFKLFFSLLALLYADTSALSFELVTHGAITNQAYNVSSLTSTDLVVHLGLADLQNAFGSRHYDISGPQVARRAATEFELGKMQDGKNNQFKIRGWLMRGAIREDDGPSTEIDYFQYADSDPYGKISRFCNHFFDPITRKPLSSTLFGDPVGYLGCPNLENVNAPNWALGTTDAFALNLVDSQSRNHFSAFNAREAMWRALTLKTKAGDPAPGMVDDSDTQRRNAYWATTFRSLGDMVHLLQDMGQPQHTRNEGHGTGHAAVFEKYADARASGAAEFKFDGEGKLRSDPDIPDGPLRALPLLLGYPIPRFYRYSDYWSTEQGSASILAGNGLADYSSRGFFTPKKNLGAAANDFPKPTNNEGAYTITTDASSSYGDCSGVPGRAQYARGDMPPDYIQTPPVASIRYASRSLVSGIWSINRCVFEDRIDLLIPRAVAYSAGLIDYFFRGQLEITPPDEGIYSLVDHADFAGVNQTATNAGQGFLGFKTIKLKLRNTTPDITPSGGGAAVPQNMVNGKLVAVLKFRRNLSYADDLTGEPDSGGTYAATRSANEEIVVSDRVRDENGNPVSTITLNADPLASTPAKLLYFEFDKQLPINATDVYLQVVYRGYLGTEEDAVVVQTLDISEPTYLAYMNSSDYILISNSIYTRAEINGTDTPPGSTLSGSQLRALVKPRSCINTTTDQVRDECFTPFAINFAMKVGDTSTTANNTTIGIPLPSIKTYARMAMLTQKSVTAKFDQTASPCFPNTTIERAGRVLQTDEATQISTATTHPAPVRGIYGFTFNCMQIGDGNIPPANIPPARMDKMTPLTGVDLKPLPLQNFKFGAP